MPKSKTKSQTNPFYTTFQVADFFGVSGPTVINWVERGGLKAHRTAGGHRRIAQMDVVSFARKRKLPIPSALSDMLKCPRVLVVEGNADVSETLAEYMTFKGLNVEVAGSSLRAGFLLAKFKPDLVVLDLMSPTIASSELLGLLDDDQEDGVVPVIGMGDIVDIDLTSSHGRLLEACVQKPIQLDRLTSKVIDLLTAAGHVVGGPH